MQQLKKHNLDDKVRATAATLKDEVVRRIEDEIVAGSLPPGTRLDEVQLAERYGLSRTPLREALAQLAAAGLVETRPRMGTFVTRLTIREIVEVLSYTAEVEGIAAGWAARRMTADERTGLVALHAACERALAASDPDLFFDANRSFHRAVHAGAHNRYAYESAKSLGLRGAPYRRLQLRLPGQLAVSYREHDRVVRAVLAEDGDEARVAMREHVMIQGDRFMEFVSALPESYIGRE